MNSYQSVTTRNARARFLLPGKSWRCFVVLLSCACHSLVTNGALAVTWTYHIVYDEHSVAPITGYTAPSLNDSGTLAFSAQVGSTYGIVKGNGGAVTTIATEGTTYSKVGPAPGINNNGLVVFEANRTNGTTGIFTGDGSGAPTAINGSLTGNFTNDLGIPEINNSGQVAFNAYSGTSLHLYTGSGGTPQLVTNDYAAAGADINNSGVIAWSRTSDVSTYSAGVNTVIQSTSGIFASFVGAPSINNSGDVAYAGNLNGGGSALAIYHAGSTSVTATSPGGFTWFRGLAAINDRGDVAFHADTSTYSGIFVGLDPTNAPVLYQGMSLFGGTAGELDFVPHGFNDLGQLAFTYWLTDGRHGLATASPPVAVPEPSTFVLAALGLAGLGFLVLRKKYRMA